MSTTSSEVVLQWNDNSQSEDAYEIQRKDGSIGYRTVAQRPSGTTSYKDAGLASGKEYYYRVRATKGMGQGSAWSNEVKARTE